LIRDIASSNRGDASFPFLRNFDIYAGHSWASGHARFGDGNNNESSSEAMNAWTGIILFAEAIGDAALRDLGIYLYTTEMNAINEYWFDVGGQNHHPNFTRATASMVWGGKTVGDGVWWTGNPEEVHGINWLPIQAGSLYLTQFPDYTRQNYEALVAENGGTNWNEWGDIIWMYRAIHNPADAINQMNAGIGSIFIERGNSRANVYHWIHNINALGTADRAVTANHPLYAVFNKQGARTYIAYNMSNAPITVSFSDGAVVNVPANAFSSGNGSGGGGDGGGDGGDDDHGHTIAGGNVQFYVNDAPWADVHYIVNNGAQQNLRMTHSGGNNSYTLAGIPAGASVRYRFTIGLAAGGATQTAWITFTMGQGGGGQDGASGHTISGSNVQFYVNDAPWADVHYTVNGGGQQNVRMTAAGGNNSYTLANVPAGASVTYRFTIGLTAGGATETAWTTFTK